MLSKTVNRNKTIQDIERDIENIQGQIVQMEVETQKQIDEFVRQKLLLYKEIDELAMEMGPKPREDVIVW